MFGPRGARLLGCQPVVKATAALLSKASRGHHLAQNCWRGEGIPAERCVKMIGNREPDIETDDVGKPEWTHRVVVAKLHGGVDVRCAGNALFEHSHRLEPEDDAEAAGGE